MKNEKEPASGNRKNGRWVENNKSDSIAEMAQVVRKKMRARVRVGRNQFSARKGFDGLTR